MKWHTKKLGEVSFTTDFVANGSFASLKKNVTYLSDGYAILVRTTDLQNNFSKRKIYIDENAYKYLVKSQLFGGELILSSVGSVGSVFICPKLEKPMSLGPNAVMIRPYPDVLNLFLYYYYLSPQGQKGLKKISNATTQSKFNKTNLRNEEIPLPPLEVQKEIVSKLDEKFAKLREAKKLREEALADTEKILSQTLREILEEGKRNGWSEKAIGSVACVGPVKSEIKDCPDNTPISFIPMSSVDEYSQSIEEQDERVLGDVRKGYTYFKRGDIILAKVTPCMENGKIAISDNLKTEIGFGSSEFHVIRGDEKKLLPKYLYQILRQEDFRLLAETKMTGTSGLKRVPKEFVENYKILLPPLPEQQKIVTQLDQLSEKIKALRELQKSQLEDLKRLEKAYLREAFSGELE